MCFASAPETPAATPPPSENPRPLANPYPDEYAGSLSQLRVGSKANLRRSKASSDPAAPSSEGTGGDGTGSSGGGDRLTIPRTPPRSQSI